MSRQELDESYSLQPKAAAKGCKNGEIPNSRAQLWSLKLNQRPCPNLLNPGTLDENGTVYLSNYSGAQYGGDIFNGYAKKYPQTANHFSRKPLLWGGSSVIGKRNYHEQFTSCCCSIAPCLSHWFFINCYHSKRISPFGIGSKPLTSPKKCG